MTSSFAIKGNLSVQDDLSIHRIFLNRKDLGCDMGSDRGCDLATIPITFIRVFVDVLLLLLLLLFFSCSTPLASISVVITLWFIRLCKKITLHYYFFVVMTLFLSVT